MQRPPHRRGAIAPVLLHLSHRPREVEDRGARLDANTVAVPDTFGGYGRERSKPRAAKVLRRRGIAAPDRAVESQPRVSCEGGGEGRGGEMRVTPQCRYTIG